MAEQCRGNPERVQRQGHPSFHIVTYCRSEFRTRPLRANNAVLKDRVRQGDRKSTRLNSSHSQISYAVFCLKKKKTVTRTRTARQEITEGACRTQQRPH